MHTETTESTDKPGAETLLNPLAQFEAFRAKQQKAALDAPILTKEELTFALDNPIFRENFRAALNCTFQILLLITPTARDESVFTWRVSLAFLNPRSGNVKSNLLWTNREKKLARKLTSFWLENCGNGEVTTKFAHGALHAAKELNFDEIQQILKWST